MAALPFDYHTHTSYSCDAHDTIDAMCRRALEIGLNEIAFTDHMDMHPKDSCYDFYRVAGFYADLGACRARFPSLILRAGIEVGEMHRFAPQVLPTLEAYPYDVVIGSLHWVGDDIVFEGDYFTGRSKDEAALDYFDEVLRMVRYGGFEVLGHLDVFRRSGADYYGDFDLAPYEDAIRAILQVCIEDGIALEVNTSGLRSALRQPHPNLQVLRWYREMGGELLTVGSDAHQVSTLAAGFDVAREVALAAGFTHLCRLERRRVVDWVAIE